MSLPVLVEPEASSELEDATVRYERQHPGLGTEFLTAADRATEHLARWPEAGTLISGLASDLPVRTVPVLRFPYRIAYLVTSDAIRVLALAHDRPGYWHTRIS